MGDRRSNTLRDGIYDRGTDRGAAFGPIIDAWLREAARKGVSQTTLCAQIGALLGRAYYPKELRRVADGKVGALHLNARTVEAYLRVFGKTSLEDRARAFRAAGVLPEDVSTQDLMLAIASSKSRVA
jgi:hypothetical protein